MITSQIETGRLIHLRQIEISDCTNMYVQWLKDPEVNQYLETKWSEQTITTIREFVESQRNNTHSVLFAIIANDSMQHIGNIKIGPVNEHYKHADISYFIGDKSFWKKGIATEAVSLVCRFGFEELKLHKIEAGAYKVAVGSWKALEKNGFKREAVLREQVYFAGRYIDVYRYGLLRGER